MIVKWPGVAPAGVVTADLGDLTDIVPTLAQMAGVTVLGPVDGVSLLPSITGTTNQAAGRKVAVVSYGGEQGLRTADYMFQTTGRMYHMQAPFVEVKVASVCRFSLADRQMQMAFAALYSLRGELPTFVQPAWPPVVDCAESTTTTIPALTRKKVKKPSKTTTRAALIGSTISSAGPSPLIITTTTPALTAAITTTITAAAATTATTTTTVTAITTASPRTTQPSTPITSHNPPRGSTPKKNKFVTLQSLLGGECLVPVPSKSRCKLVCKKVRDPTATAHRNCAQLKNLLGIIICSRLHAWVERANVWNPLNSFVLFVLELGCIGFVLGLNNFQCLPALKVCLIGDTTKVLVFQLVCGHRHLSAISSGLFFDRSCLSREVWNCYLINCK